MAVCHACNREIGDERFCAYCGAVQGAEAQTNLDPGAPAYELASFGKRLVAVLIDGLVYSIVYLPLMFAAVVSSVAGFDSPRPYFGGYQLFTVLVPVVYFGLMEGQLGRTLGKMAMGLRVVDQSSGEIVGLGRGFLRAVARQGFIVLALNPIGFLWFLVDGLWMLWDDRTQTLHDKVASTIVIDNPKPKTVTFS